jgi:hypothetical protein
MKNIATEFYCLGLGLRPHLWTGKDRAFRAAEDGGFPTPEVVKAVAIP